MSPVIFLIIEIFILGILLVIIRETERTRNVNASLELNYVIIGITILKIILTGFFAYQGLTMCNLAKNMYC
jgi:heme/copper-type cytochrome/quinol oxidase subunit 2